MEESKDTETSLICPSCGAPYREVIPSNVAQVKCKYCGSIFPISPYLKDIVPRCPHHPETFATGLCNDCGENFCTQCLHMYNLKSEGDGATLYLCPECLQKRQVKEANYLILLGVLFIFAWVPFFLAIPIVGVLLILFVSTPIIVYGVYKRSRLLETPSIYDERDTVLTQKAEISEATQDIDIDTLYGKMLGKYAMRWGVLNAKELLDNEIYAYVRQGLDYNEAVRRVAQNKGIIKAAARAKAEVEAETEKENKSKEIRKSKMVR